MTIESVSVVGKFIALIMLYGITGFGPGLMLGITIANLVAGRGNLALRNKHNQDIRAAAEHNAQWHPSHKRWQDQ